MILDDIADLASSALSTGTWIVGTTVFKGPLPSTPDDCLAFLGPYGGAPAVWAMSPGVGAGGRPQVEMPRVQALSRAARYDDAEKNAIKLRYALGGLYGAVKNGVLYKSIVEVQEPFYLELDQGNRPVFAINFEITRVAVTSS